MSFVKVAVLGAMLLGCGGTKAPSEPSVCDVEGVVVEAGRTLPDRDCFVCDPAVTRSDLTMLPVGTACDDGRAATTGDACDGQGRCAGNASTPTSCTIAGATYATGESPADNACVYCDPGNVASSWTMRKAGAVCDDGNAATAGDKCDGAGRCVGTGGTIPGAVGEACSDAHACDGYLVCHEGVCRETCTPLPLGDEYCAEDVFCIDVSDGLGVCVPA